MLLNSEQAGGTSTSCSDLQHHLGWSFAGVTSWLCHLLGGPCWCPVHPPQPGKSMARFGMGAWLVAGEAVEQLGAGLGTPGMAGSLWDGWELLGAPGMPGSPWEPLAGAAVAAVDLFSIFTVQSEIRASLPVAKPSSAIGPLTAQSEFPARSLRVPPGGAMSERRAATKGRRLGSSRRKQLRESSGDAPAPAPSPAEEPPWASEIVQRVQQLLGDRDTEQAGIVTREDVQVRTGRCPGVRHCRGGIGGFSP